MRFDHLGPHPDVIIREIKVIQDLLEEEPDSKCMGTCASSSSKACSDTPVCVSRVPRIIISLYTSSLPRRPSILKTGNRQGRDKEDARTTNSD